MLNDSFEIKTKIENKEHSSVLLVEYTLHSEDSLILSNVLVEYTLDSKDSLILCTVLVEYIFHSEDSLILCTVLVEYTLHSEDLSHIVYCFSRIYITQRG